MDKNGLLLVDRWDLGIDISSTPSGTSYFGNVDGLASGPLFQVKMKVPGTGVIRPERCPAVSDDVIVRYSY
jgi:hypothetical protein